MTYLAQTYMVQDNILIARVAACAAQQGVSDPPIWAARNIWAVSAHPGLATAYSQADGALPDGDPAAHAPKVGADPEVITDEMILAAVQGILSPQEEEQEPIPTEEEA